MVLTQVPTVGANVYTAAGHKQLGADSAALQIRGWVQNGAMR